MVRLLLVALLSVGVVTAGASTIDDLFEQGQSWTAFLAGARSQRLRWLQVDASARPRPTLVARMRRVASGLRLLIVAEDWCPDSVEAVPHIAALAREIGIPLRLIDRRSGASLLEVFRTIDGRPATPTVALIKNHEAVAAWVERPAIVQRWFLGMARSHDDARRFEARAGWYDTDAGQTILEELVALAERSAKEP